MKHPHFAQANSVMDHGATVQRRFRGRLIVDTPVQNDPPPALLGSALQLPPLDDLCDMMRIQSSLSSTRAREILTRLKDGTYLTRSAAEQCAERMLDAEEALESESGSLPVD